METLPDLVTRLRSELAEARKTRSRIMKAGQSSAFGGVSMQQAALREVLQLIRQLEADLFNAEAALAGSDVEAGVSYIRVSAT